MIWNRLRVDKAVKVAVVAGATIIEEAAVVTIAVINVRISFFKDKF